MEGRFFRGMAWAALICTPFWALLIILISIWLAPKQDPHACIKPTAMPATWFGDCGAHHTSGNVTP